MPHSLLLHDLAGWGNPTTMVRQLPWLSLQIANERGNLSGDSYV